MFANVVGAFPASRVFVWQWKWTHPNLYGPCFPSAVLFQQHLLWRQEESTVTFLSILKLQQQLLCDRKSKSSTPFLVDWTFYERKWLVKASVGACEYFSIISHIKNSKTPTHENKVGTGLMFNSGWSRKSANPAVSLKYKQLVNEAYAISCLPLPSMTTQLHCFQKKRKKKENTVGVEGPHNHRIVWSRGGSFQRGRERRREWKHHKTPAAVMWETVNVHLPSCSPPASPHLSFFSPLPIGDSTVYSIWVHNAWRRIKKQTKSNVYFRCYMFELASCKLSKNPS